MVCVILEGPLKPHISNPSFPSCKVPLRNSSFNNLAILLLTHCSFCSCLTSLIPIHFISPTSTHHPSLHLHQPLFLYSCHYYQLLSNNLPPVTPNDFLHLLTFLQSFSPVAPRFEEPVGGSLKASYLALPSQAARCLLESTDRHRNAFALMRVHIHAGCVFTFSHTLTQRKTANEMYAGIQMKSVEDKSQLSYKVSSRMWPPKFALTSHRLQVSEHHNSQQPCDLNALLDF